MFLVLGSSKNQLFGAWPLSDSWQNSNTSYTQYRRLSQKITISLNKVEVKEKNIKVSMCLKEGTRNMWFGGIHRKAFRRKGLITNIIILILKLDHMIHCKFLCDLLSMRIHESSLTTALFMTIWSYNTVKKKKKKLCN